MEQKILYFLVIIVANAIGAVSGMGGGVIIKPVLDFIAWDNVATISFYSSVAVFVMSISSTVRQIQSGQKLKVMELSYLAIGSIFGGYIGSLLFDCLLVLSGSRIAQFVQVIITVLMLLFALLASKKFFKQYNFIHKIWYFLCGFLLGAISSFLGIGGGPINVSFFIILFGLPIKKATVYSIATIFFSQLSKIISLVLISKFNQFDSRMLMVIIIAAIFGGIFGAKFSKILSEDKIAIVFQLVVVAVLALNIYNLFAVVLE